MVRSLALILFLFFPRIAISSPPEAAHPVTLNQLVAWVAGGMFDDHVALYVQRQGLAFQPQNQDLETLKGIGASETVLAALRAAKKSGAKAEAHPSEDAVFQHLLEGARAVQEKKYDAAAQALSLALTLEPDNADLHYALANVFRQQEDWQEAAKQYTECIRIAPGFADPYEGLSYSYHHMNDGDDAVAEARVALKILPNDPESHRYMGIALETREDLDGAIREYREAIRLKPDYAAAFYDLGISLSLERNFEGAIASYREAIRLEPDNWMYFTNLCVTYHDRGDSKNAIPPCREAKRLAPEANQLQVRQNLAGILYDAGEYQAAVTEYQELLAKVPQLKDARFSLGKSLLKTGQVDEAIKVFQEGIQSDSDYSDMHLGLAGALYTKGDLKQAEREFRRAAELDPESPLPHQNLGGMLYESGQFGPSFVEYEKAIELEPDNTDRMISVARLYQAHDKLDKAEVLFKRVIPIFIKKFGPEDPKVALQQEELAFDLTHEHKYDEAEPLFKQAIQTLQKQSNKDELKTALNNYDFMLRQANRTADTKPVEKRLESLTAGDAASSDPAKAWSAFLGQATQAMMERKFEESEINFRKALEQAQKFPRQDQRYVMTIKSFAVMYQQWGKIPEAEGQYKHELEIQEQGFGAQSKEAAGAWSDLVNFYLSAKNNQAAEEAAQKGLAIAQKEPNVTDADLSEPLRLLATVYSFERDYAKAEPLYLRVLAQSEKTYGPDDARIAVNLDSLAALYMNSKQYAKAEPYYRRMLSLGEKQYGPDSPMLSGTLYVMADLMRKLGRPQEAEVYEDHRKIVEAARNSPQK